MALFVVWFDLDVGDERLLGELRHEIVEYMRFLDECILERQIELTETIKTCMYLKFMWLIGTHGLPSKSASSRSGGFDRYTDPFNKRIVDLMRSEFSILKANDSTTTTTTSSHSNIQDLTAYVINEPESLYNTFVRNCSKGLRSFLSNY